MDSSPSALPGTQTLARGLGVLHAVAAGSRDLKALAGVLDIPRSTAHRLASCLVQERYLRVVPGLGYTLGPRLIELGFQAREESPLPALARPFAEQLSQRTGATIHLGVREGSDVLYLDKIPGRHGLEMRSRVGQRMPLVRTGIGKALLLDLEDEQWKTLFDACTDLPAAVSHAPTPSRDGPAFLQRMREYAAGGYALDLEDNEPTIRCVAAPIRDASGRIAAAISIASTVSYMPLERMRELIPVVIEAARGITGELGGAKHSGTRREQPTVEAPRRQAFR